MKPNPEYEDAALEIASWSPETGRLTMKEVSRGPNGIRLQGIDEKGKMHVEIWKPPVWDKWLWKGELSWNSK